MRTAKALASSAAPLSPISERGEDSAVEAWEADDARDDYGLGEEFERYET